MKKLLLLTLALIVALFVLPSLLLYGRPALSDGITGRTLVPDVTPPKPSPLFSTFVQAPSSPLLRTDTSADTAALLAATDTAAPPEKPVMFNLPDDAQPDDTQPGTTASDDAQPGTTASDDEQTTLRLITSSGVKTMTLADYLPGAITAEMPPTFPEEALKAQAVAVRTLAYHRMSVSKHTNGDLCTNPACCLAYKTPDERCANAAADTNGEVMLSDGEPILAAFHSSAGGKTRASAAVWGGALSYLVAVDSPDADMGKRGHGVGMSQYGARAMAQLGSTYAEILEHYYTGVELSTAG